jgi:predicted PurR-regulated permease PerM
VGAAENESGVQRAAVEVEGSPRVFATPPQVNGAALDDSLSRRRTWALVAVVLASFIGVAAIVAPLWIALLLGGEMAISAWRPYLVVKRRLGDRPRLSAAIVTVVCGLLFAGVGFLVMLKLTNELVRLGAHLQESGGGVLERLLGAHATRAIERLGVDTSRVSDWLQQQLEAAASFAASTLALALRTASEAVLGLVLALLAMYYALLEGPSLQGRLEAFSPLEPRHTRALIVEAREVGRTAFIGTLATAIVQGVLAGLGYAALGVPQPVLWAMVTALASFLPVVGTLIVWIPISAYLFVEGHPVRAVLLLAWGAIIVTSLADYVIRPRIVGTRGHGHPLLTLISLLGGIKVFGLAGLIVAPIVMSVFVAALRIYLREVRGAVIA